MFLTLGVPVAISRFVAQDEKHAQSILQEGIRLQALVALGIAGIVFVTSPLIAQLLRDTTLTPLLAFTAIIILSQALYPIYVQYLSGLHRFNKQAALTAVYAIAKLAGAITLLYIFHVYGALGGFAVGGTVAAVIGWYWTRSLGGSRRRRLPLKAFLSFAGLYVLILVGIQVLISLDLFMVKAILKDNNVAGYYSGVSTLARISYLLLQGLAFVLLPSVSRLTEPGRPKQEASQFISESIRYLIALIVPAVVLAAATSKPLLLLFFQKSEFVVAAPALTILMLGLGSIGFYLLLANIVSGAGKPQVGLCITMLLIAVSGALGWFLIPTFGLLGAAWQTTIAGFIGLALLGGYAFRKFAIPLPLRSTINILIATAVAVSLTYLWQATPLTLIPQYVVVGLLYILVLVLLQEVTPADRKRIAGMHPALRWVAPHSK
jgi:O-antigen/teichoic acid export membrane protein